MGAESAMDEITEGSGYNDMVCFERYSTVSVDELKCVRSSKQTRKNNPERVENVYGNTVAGGVFGPFGLRAPATPLKMLPYEPLLAGSGRVP